MSREKTFRKFAIIFAFNAFALKNNFRANFWKKNECENTCEFPKLFCDKELSFLLVYIPSNIFMNFAVFD